MSISRRRLLGAVATLSALSGCNGLGGGSDTRTDPDGTERPTDTLEVGTRSPSPSSEPTATPTASPAPTETPKPTDTPTATQSPTETATPTPRPSNQGGNSGGSAPSGGGDTPTGTQTPASTASPTPTPTESTPNELVISQREARESAANYYERVLWYDSGALVLEDGAGVGLMEVNE